MKMRGFIPPAGLVLALVVAFFGGGAIVWAGVGWIRDYQSDALRDKCNYLDYAVRRYNCYIVDRICDELELWVSDKDSIQIRRKV